MAETDFNSVLNVIRNAKQQPVNSASRRAAINEAERFLNERRGKAAPGGGEADSRCEARTRLLAPDYQAPDYQRVARRSRRRQLPPLPGEEIGSVICGSAIDLRTDESFMPGSAVMAS